MNKLLVSLLFVLVLMIGVASAAAPLTVVSGVITDGNKNLVSGASVKVTCTHNSVANVKNVLTGNDGKYYAFYSTTLCADGDKVLVEASKENAEGNNGGAVSYNGNCKINTSLVDVQIPEFGVIGGAVVLLAGVGIILYRRKQNE